METLSRDGAEARWTTPSHHQADLGGVDLTSYKAQAAQGRAGLSTELRQWAKKTNAEAKELCRTAGSESPLVNFLRAATEGEAILCDLEKPRYIGYTNLPLLEWYLGTEDRLALPETRTRAWRAFSVLLEDLQDHHRQRVANGATAADFVVGSRGDRESKINALWSLIPSDYRPAVILRPEQPLATIRQYYGDPDAALRDLTAFPQSKVPDEYVFLRAIHLSEVGFWGTSVHVQKALNLIAEGNRGSEVVETLMHAAAFAETLTPIMHVVRSMLQDTFAAFRDATGDASAVQSARYQLMEAQVYGVLPEKRPVLSKIPEAQAALMWNDMGNTPLVKYSELLQSEGCHEIFDAICAVEKALFGWRTFHMRQMAGGGYLPPQSPGSGNTGGYNYLASHQPPRPNKPQHLGGAN